MMNEGHSLILAESEEGMYQVIVPSYDEKDAAAAKREDIQRYSAKATPIT